MLPGSEDMFAGVDRKCRPPIINVEIDPQQTSELILDHLVGKQEQLRWDIEIERLSRIEVDD
ncbi:MAG: hypothetical protein QOG67_3897 [Verrucomicrobiota bacterium]|jgi:hypothetical protein